jgi:hypothetical protein
MLSHYVEKIQDDPVAGFTALLVLATLFLAGIAYLQIKQGRIVQRAYVAVEPLGIHLMVEGDRVIGHIGIRNAGRLPARQLSWFINIKHSDNGDEEVFPLENGKGNIIVTPGAEAIRGSDTQVTLQDLISASGMDAAGGARNREKPLYLYVWGAVYYKDGIRWRRRSTKFCHRYNWIVREKNGAARYEIDKQYARYHEHGNDAD